MKTQIVCLIVIFISFAVHAGETAVVAENVISKWGYFTKQLPGTYDYKKLNHIDPATSVKYQLIRSTLPVRGQTDTYFYFTLSEECYSYGYSAIRRRVALALRDEKDYKLAFIKGKCVYITDCAAKMDTFEEQPRIHKLFEEYVLGD